jgi:hypothetical protein
MIIGTASGWLERLVRPMREALRYENNRTFLNFGDLPPAVPVTKSNEIGDVATTMRTGLGDRTIVSACNPPQRFANVRAHKQNSADLFDIPRRDQWLTREGNLYRRV